MQAQQLAVIRYTKLDIAQWIAAGLGNCRNPATSLCLARYAAAQLQSAALIPLSPRKVGRHKPCDVSLLRRELRSSARDGSSECALILARVSRSMLRLLAVTGPADPTAARLLRHEAAASREIRALCRG